MQSPWVGHHFRHGLDLNTGTYMSMISEWRRQRWSVTVSDMQAWTCTLDCQLRAMRENPPPPPLHPGVLRSFLGGATCGVSVWKGGLSRLRAFLIKKKKCKKSSAASAASSVALRSLPEADHCGQRIEYRTRNREAGCAVPSLVDSSSQSSPDISPKDCFKYRKF